MLFSKFQSQFNNKNNINLPSMIFYVCFECEKCPPFKLKEKIAATMTIKGPVLGQFALFPEWEKKWWKWSSLKVCFQSKTFTSPPPSSLKKLNSSNQYSLLFLLLLLYLFWVSYILYPYVIVIECRTLLMQLSITIFPMTTKPKNRRDIIFDPFLSRLFLYFSLLYCKRFHSNIRLSYSFILSIFINSIFFLL